jgi:hypothetical protein
VDAHQALLDARVAEAAEVWLTDPADVGAYARLIAAVEQRRRWLHRDGRPGAVADRATDPDGVTHSDGATLSATHSDGATLPATHSDGATPSNGVTGPVDATDPSGSSDPDGPDEHLGVSPESADEPSDDELDRSWPTVRAVGVDLAGDPVAVLRRLRGG